MKRIYKNPELTKQKMSQSRKGISPWNKGKKIPNMGYGFLKGHPVSLENRIKVGLSNKTRIVSEATRLKISNGNKGKKRSKQFIARLRSLNLGTKKSEETKQKIRIARLNNPLSVFKDTNIELKIEAELIKRGINYQKQVPLCKIARVDFYLPEYRIVIQADGCYWHNCPIHGGTKFTKSVEKSIKQDNILTFNGFNVYRFWEHDIKKSVEDCINKINFE